MDKRETEKLKFRIDNGTKMTVEQVLIIKLLECAKSSMKEDIRHKSFEKTGRKIWNDFKVPHWGVVGFLSEYNYEI